LDELNTYQRCALESAGTVLARFEDQAPLLVRVPTPQGGALFCTTLPTAQFSSLERDGVVFYAMLQRALAEGSRPLASASQRDAAAGALADRDRWERVAPAEEGPSPSARGLQAGVYRSEGYWTAVNRNAAEDDAGVTPTATVDELFGGVSYQRIDDTVGSVSPLAREVWRAFLVAMMLALILEAALCLPGRRMQAKRFSDFGPTAGVVRDSL
jgi:hypothetical protein